MRAAPEGSAQHTTHNVGIIVVTVARVLDRVLAASMRAPSEAGGVAFGCAGAFRIGLQSGGACGMYRPSIGPVSAIERAIVCMRMPGLADLRQPISRGFLLCRPQLFLRVLCKEPS